MPLRKLSDDEVKKLGLPTAPVAPTGLRRLSPEEASTLRTW